MASGNRAWHLAIEAEVIRWVGRGKVVEGIFLGAKVLVEKMSDRKQMSKNRVENSMIDFSTKKIDSKFSDQHFSIHFFDSIFKKNVFDNTHFSFGFSPTSWFKSPVS